MLIKIVGGGMLALCCGVPQAAPERSYAFSDSGAIVAVVAKESYRGGSDRQRERTLNWTPATTFLTSAVPEPTTYGMLAFGVVLVVVAARRQRRFLRG